MMRRERFLWTASVALAASTLSPVRAQMQRPELSGHAEPKERPFLDAASRFLHGAYPKPSLAARAGFFQFTPEDRTGAISWANLHWTSTDAEHPSQVWYDVHGRLIGADYSVLQTDSPDRPRLWNIDPRRWIGIHAHVHFGLREAGGIKFGATSTGRFEGAGGTISAPDKSVLVRMGIAKSVQQVAFVFLFPSIWDLQFWVIPNPDGRFAEYNPNVKPQHAQPHPKSM
jgi:hypothetical protein